MAVLKVETGVENAVLRQKSKPVRSIDRNIQKLLKDMEATMEAGNGCGLAALQVGFPLRIIMVKLNQLTDQELNIAMINPEITYFSEDTYVDEEGCLSVPGYFDQVERASKIIVRFQNAKGRELVLKMSELNARVVQHEIDHLDGILFTDLIVGGVPGKLLGEDKQERHLKL